MLERSSSQSLAPQVLHAGGECEGRRVDGGRGGVPQEEEPQGEQSVDQVRPAGEYFAVVSIDYGSKNTFWAETNQKRMLNQIICK